MKTVFMGTPDYAVTCLNALIEAGHEVALVVTQTDKAKDRGKKVQFTPVKERAIEAGIEVVQPEKVKDNEEFFNRLKEIEPDIIIVVAYGQIIPESILKLPKFGAINVHASLLPKLRGASPIQHAIVNGEEVTGVTIMQMSNGLDKGDMLSKAEVEIGSMNYSELHDKLADAGAKLLAETLPLIEQGLTDPEPQDDSMSTYAGLIYKQDGKIDFSKDPEVIERLIRGFDPWPGAFCEYNGMTLKLWHARVVEASGENDAVYGEILKADKDGILIKCGSGMLLVTEIQVPGKKRVSVSDYIRGNSIEKGTVLR